MRRRGFTKVELLVVIGMIAVLASILFPVFAKTRETARKGLCLNNLWHIGQALRLYAFDGDGRYPPIEDDLSPLYPRYLGTDHVFQCPSAPHSTTPMGAPANPKLLPSKPEGPPMGPQGGPGMPPGGPGMPGPPPSGPAPPQSVAPAGPIIAFVQDEGAPPPDDRLKTAYYYRALRRHNQTPRAPLCSEHELQHIDRANVLYSDGSLESVLEAPWRAKGFRPLKEIRPPTPPHCPDPRSDGGSGGP